MMIKNISRTILFIYVVNLENNNQVIAWDHIILDIEEDKKDGD